MPETYFIRKALVSIDLEPEFQWQEDAACRFQPHTLFEIASFDSEIAEEIVPDGDDPQNALTDLNLANFERAKQICNTCPVWDLCYTEADEDDFKWTVRAGIIPTKFNATPSGRPRKAVVPKKVSLVHGAVPGGKYCSEGHCNWYNKPNGERTCRTCKLDADRIKRPRVGIKVDPNKPCTACDTKNWRKRTDNGGYVCRTCKVNKSKVARWKKDGISFDSSQPCASGHMDWKPRKVYGENRMAFFCVPCKAERATIKA